MIKKTAVALALALALTACSAAKPASPKPSETTAPSVPQTITVVTHDSFNLPDEIKAQFEKDTGIKVTYSAPGDAGSLVNQLILTKDAPIGDVVYGIDNTLATKAVDAGVLEPFVSTKLPTSAESMKLGDALTPINFGDVCLNADKKYFADKKLAVPATLDDLVKPEYKDMMVVENAASSSPGLAFLIATIGAKGEAGYLDYWKQLKANGVKVAKGWTEAYTVDFSGSEGKGKYPLVVSYASSPSAEVPKGASESNTVALLDTCFRQVEYAAVIKGSKNAEAAKKYVDFLLSAKVQAAIPGEMYMYPADASVPLPESWAKHAKAATKPITVDPAQIAKNRDAWVKAWTATAIG